MRDSLLSVDCGVVVVNWSCFSRELDHEERNKSGSGACPRSPAAFQLSAPGVDAAEPVTASASDGTFYVAWVNHDAKQADVMLARFTSDGAMQGSPVRVNRQPGCRNCMAWRSAESCRSLQMDPFTWSGPRVLIPESKHGTDLYMSVSNDRGQSFASEVKINDDKVPGRSWHALARSRKRRTNLRRLARRAKRLTNRNHRQKPTAITWKVIAIFSSLTRPMAGALFQRTGKLLSDACPCCKTALAVSSGRNVVRRLASGFAWKLSSHRSCQLDRRRQQRFHRPKIVSDDRWVLQGCPVSGPSLSVDPKRELESTLVRGG